jgi:hypothetical protein
MLSAKTWEPGALDDVASELYYTLVTGSRCSCARTGESGALPVKSGGRGEGQGLLQSHVIQDPPDQKSAPAQTSRTGYHHAID